MIQLDLGGNCKCQKMPTVNFQNVGAQGKLLQGHGKNSCLWRKDIFNDFDRADIYKLLNACSVLCIVGNMKGDC